MFCRRQSWTRAAPWWMAGSGSAAPPRRPPPPVAARTGRTAAANRLGQFLDSIPCRSEHRRAQEGRVASGVAHVPRGNALPCQYLRSVFGILLSALWIPKNNPSILVNTGKSLLGISSIRSDQSARGQLGRVLLRAKYGAPFPLPRSPHALMIYPRQVEGLVASDYYPNKLLEASGGGSQPPALESPSTKILVRLIHSREVSSEVRRA